jgi:MobA/MobL family
LDARSGFRAAAYQTGTQMEDRTTRETHDYTLKGGVMSVFVVAPPDAPEWARDPEQLASAMEARETRKNSQLAFECRLALPACLDETDREEIAREFSRTISDRYGGVIGAVHAPDRNGDERNFHVHILFTTHRLEAEGLTEKVRAFNTGRLAAIFDSTRERALPPRILFQAHPKPNPSNNRKDFQSKATPQCSGSRA